MTTLPSHAHKGRCIYNSSVQSNQVLQLMYLPKTQAKSIMTKALGGTNHFEKKSYAQIVSTGEKIISHSQSFNTLLASGRMGSNHSPATAWERGNRSFHCIVSNKASAKSSNQDVAYECKDTSTRILCKQGNLEQYSSQTVNNGRGRSYFKCPSINNSPDHGVPVHNRYHILDLNDANENNEQLGNTDKLNSQQQSSKNNNPIRGKTNKANTDFSGHTRTDEKPCRSQQHCIGDIDFSGRTCTDVKPCRSQQHRIGNADFSGHTCTDDNPCRSQQTCIANTDSPQDKTVISAQRDIRNMESCKEFLLCQQQLNTSFGCIPLTAIKTDQGPVKIWNVTPDLFTAHNMIKSSSLPNFWGLRIPVDTNLNIPAWRKYLCNYFDQQLVDLIEYGFPLILIEPGNWRVLYKTMLQLEII